MMSGITIQPFTVEKLEQIHAILLEDLPELPRILGFMPTPANMRRQTIDDPDFVPEHFLGAYIDGELAGFIMGVLRVWKKGREETGYIKWIFVRPKYRRRGLGRALLETCRTNLLKSGAKKLFYGSSAPCYFFPGVFDKDLDTRKLLEACGWHRGSARVSINANIKTVDIHPDDIDKLVKANELFLRVNIAAPEDASETLAFIEREFGHSWAMESEPAFGKKGTYCSIVRHAHTGEIFGFAVINASNPYWFGPMGVRTDLRGKGIGLLLVNHTLLIAQERGIDHLIFPWINEKEQFYRKIIKDAERQVFYGFETDER